MKTAIIAAACSLALVGSAAAQPAMSSQIPAEPQPAPIRTEGLLSENTALWLSLGGTLGSVGLLASSAFADDSVAGVLGLTGAVGLVFAPSFGHWYAGKGWTRGMGLRLGGMAIGTVGLAWAVGEAFDYVFDHWGDGDGQGMEEDDDEVSAGPLVLLFGGLGMVVAGAVDDIVTAPRRVRRHNERLIDVTVAPLAVSRGGGLALTGRF